MSERNLSRHDVSESDADLRARFGELRARTRGPEFAAVLGRASADARAQPALTVSSGRPSRRRMLAAGVWASAAIAATVAGILLFDFSSLMGPSADEQFAELVASYSADVATGAWRSPTSGLLNVPGMELVRGMPTIGGVR
jgi:hypothetical protein